MSPCRKNPHHLIRVLVCSLVVTCWRGGGWPSKALHELTRLTFNTNFSGNQIAPPYPPAFRKAGPPTKKDPRTLSTRHQHLCCRPHGVPPPQARRRGTEHPLHHFSSSGGLDGSVPVHGGGAATAAGEAHRSDHEVDATKWKKRLVSPGSWSVALETRSLHVEDGHVPVLSIRPTFFLHNPMGKLG